MTDDMDHPVTRRELREELANHPTRQELREELANCPTRKELHEALAVWGGALEERIVTRIMAHTTAEIARHVTASEERIRADMRAMLDPHQGVPERVTGLEARVERLETKALAPKRARRRRPR